MSQYLSHLCNLWRCWINTRKFVWRVIASLSSSSCPISNIVIQQMQVIAISSLALQFLSLCHNIVHFRLIPFFIVHCRAIYHNTTHSLCNLLFRSPAFAWALYKRIYINCDSCVHSKKEQKIVIKLSLTQFLSKPYISSTLDYMINRCSQMVGGVPDQIINKPTKGCGNRWSL